MDLEKAMVEHKHTDIHTHIHRQGTHVVALQSLDRASGKRETVGYGLMTYL